MPGPNVLWQQHRATKGLGDEPVLRDSVHEPDLWNVSWEL